MLKKKAPLWRDSFLKEISVFLIGLCIGGYLFTENMEILFSLLPVLVVRFLLQYQHRGYLKDHCKNRRQLCRL